MFFTQEDYIKIQQWLIKNSVKDTEFNEATIPFNGNEIVSIVQGNQNKKVFLKDLLSQIFNLGVSDFVNITDKYDAPNISLEEAIRLIPSRARKEGQVITFLDREDHWHIYQFKGVLNQWNVLDQWKDLFDFDINNFIIDSILPDEEDLTKSSADENGNSYLSLKDREYNPEDFSGLGRIILRKNIVEVEDPIYGKVKKNVLYQDMFTQSNTIYEIRYDFDLNGKEITIPEGCVLDFQGGSLSNGKILFQDTYLLNNIKINSSIECDGTISNEELNVCWFGAVPSHENDNVTDCSKSIQTAIDLAAYSDLCLKVYIPSGYYGLSKPILLIRNKNIELYGSEIGSHLIAMSNMDYMIGAKDMSNKQYISSIIHDLYLDGHRTDEYYKDGVFNNSTTLAKRGVYFPCGFIYSKIYNLRCHNFDYYCIDIGEIYQVNITGCTFRYSDRGIALTGNTNNVGITNNEFGIIKEFGLITNCSHAVYIEQNCFEVIGNAAIVLHRGGTTFVRANYIEDCSLNGIVTNNYKEALISKVYPSIIIPGVSISEYYDKQNVYKMRGSYPTKAIIEGNNIQDIVLENSCLVYASCLQDSKIACNTLNVNIPLLLIGRDDNTFHCNDIEISNNTKGCKKVKLIDIDSASIYSDSNDRYNIYSFDNYDVINNLNRKIHHRTYQTKTLKEIDETYRGMRVYEAKEKLTLTPNTDLLGEIDSSIILTYFFYRYRDGKWNECYIENGNISLNSGDKITLPKCSHHGGLPFSVIPEYEIFGYGQNLIAPYGIYGKDNHILPVYNNKYVQYAKYLIENDDSPNDKLFPLFIRHNSPKDEVSSYIYHYSNKYIGIEAIDDYGRVVRHIGDNKWRTTDGYPSFNTSGNSSERPISITSQDVGFKYFDTTLNKPIWWTGTVWVDADGVEV